MEETKRKYNLRPLPGGRRGARGAGAGCFSSRDTGDVKLSRRALVTQTVTADRQGLNRRAHDIEVTAESTSGDDTHSLFSSIPSTRLSPTRRRASSTLSNTTSLGSVVQDLPCTRKRWNNEMNQFILRTYLQLTALDTDTQNLFRTATLKIQ